LPPTTHSGDAALMRFRCLGWHFMCFVQFLEVSPLHLDTVTRGRRRIARRRSEKSSRCR
jgi:hypothetical protein